MKLPAHVDTRPAGDLASAQPTLRVCMHVLECLRTDTDRVMREATALIEEGFAVTIIDIEGDRDCPAAEDVNGIRVKHIVTPGWFNYSRRFSPWFLMIAAWLLLRSILRLLLTPADIYHAHDAKALPASFIAAWLRHKPLIFDAHELPLAEETIRWRGLSRITRKLLAGMVPYCAGVITVSSPIAREMSRRYHYPEVSLVRNILAYSEVSRNDRLQQHLGLSSETRIVLYQGNIQPDRQLDRLVRAAAFLEQNTVLVLMGRDKVGSAAELVALACRVGVADRVKILPPVPYKDLLAWTASADIGLIVYSPNQSLNVKLCLPNKLFEYVMAGLPTLATPLDAIAEVLSTYDVGRVVSSLEPEEIAAAIDGMLADHEALASMRRNALVAARNEFNWEKERRQLIHLYRDVQTKWNVRHSIQHRLFHLQASTLEDDEEIGDTHVILSK